jgi:hypothetical protein
MVATPMPTTKRELAEALCEFGHISARVSTVKNKFSKEALTEKVWAAQCTACGYEQAQAEPDDADDGERSDAGSMPSLAANSSTDGNGSGGVSEAEDVEEQEQAPAPTAAPARRPLTAQSDTTASRALQGQRAEKATRDAKRTDERGSG